MKKVITYGTYDSLHYGHIRLLERAKQLGDYLIVGVTSDTYDRLRGKINVKYSLTERIEAIRETGLADEIIIEEYEGQKIDDIKRYNIDVFAIGSDWKGKFDYLKEYCQVKYLDRTEGISSTDIRTSERGLRLALVGDSITELKKMFTECQFVNGIHVVAIYSPMGMDISSVFPQNIKVYNSYEDVLKEADALYIIAQAAVHYKMIVVALKQRKHILCESPLSFSREKAHAMFELAKRNGCILMEAIKTAYSLAFSRLQLLLKTGCIGEIYSVDATCTSLYQNSGDFRGSFASWGPFALLPVFSILGVDYTNKSIQTKYGENGKDIFTKVNFTYQNAVASIKVANGVKSEGDLIISGTEGYIFVPAPWWKTDYFEVRYENMKENKRYFYQLEGEGIRYMLVCFVKAITNGSEESYISKEITLAISQMMEKFLNGEDVIKLGNEEKK